MLLPAPTHAQDENRAGLVIVHGDGSVVQQCVSFVEESISGYELLQRAGGELNVEAGAMGATVCSIGGEGCSYPAESCFCRCQGSPCVYWSYWRLQEDGGWRYQPLGAANTRVGDGDVEAWRWAEGTTRDAPEPPAVQFEAVCTPETQATSATPPGNQTPAADPAGSTPAPASAAAPTAASVAAPTVMPTVTVQAAANASPAEATTPDAAADTTVAVGPEDEQVGMSGGLAIALAAVLLLPAAVLLIWALVRRKR